LSLAGAAQSWLNCTTHHQWSRILRRFSFFSPINTRTILVYSVCGHAFWSLYCS
jgi:hypothetical protein